MLVPVERNASCGVQGYSCMNWLTSLRQRFLIACRRHAMFPMVMPSDWNLDKISRSSLDRSWYLRVVFGKLYSTCLYQGKNNGMKSESLLTARSHSSWNQLPIPLAVDSMTMMVPGLNGTDWFNPTINLSGSSQNAHSLQ